MKTILRIFLYLGGFLGLVILLFAGFLQIRGIPKYEPDKVDLKIVSDSAKVEMGAKIASVQCIVCHRGKDGKLSGRELKELPPEFGEIHSANITQSKTEGIGNWTDGEIYALLRTGVRPDGRFAPNYMPKFPHMSEADMHSVIAWLRSDKYEVQTSETQAVSSKPSLLTKFLCLVQFKKIPLPEKPVLEPDTNNKIAYGRYLIVGRYDCYPCHSADFKTLNQEFPEQTGGYLGGGNLMVALDGAQRITTNITPHATGLGTWNEEEFKNAMVYGKSKNGRQLRDPMMNYSGLTDLELNAMWRYLLSVPPIDNEIDRKWD